MTKESSKTIKTDGYPIGKFLRNLPFPSFKETFSKQKTHKVVPGPQDDLL